VVAEARRRGIGIEATGGAPGGSVSGGTALPAGYTAEDQARDVQTRRESALPAMASYDAALDARNASEGIHGAAMARQLQAFKDKYGIDLKRSEFALKQQELAQQAPKTAAEARYYDANAKKVGAEATALPGKTKSYMAQFHINTANKLMDELVNPLTEEPRKAEIRQSLATIEAELNDLDSKNSGERKAGAGIVSPQKPTLEAFKKAVREKGSKLSDPELDRYYSENYGG
jgi:hypothetical protein